jgi:hypothetical protein
MSISRRKLIRVFSTLTIGIGAMFTAKVARPISHRELLGHKLHDDVSVSLLETYARCMALEDKDARWQAQMWFHEAQSARSGGGTMSQKLGHRLNAFLNKHEGKVLTPSDLHALTITR